MQIKYKIGDIVKVKVDYPAPLPGSRDWVGWHPNTFFKIISVPKTRGPYELVSVTKDSLGSRLYLYERRICLITEMDKTLYGD